MMETVPQWSSRAGAPAGVGIAIWLMVVGCDGRLETDRESRADTRRADACRSCVEPDADTRMPTDTNPRRDSAADPPPDTRSRDADAADGNAGPTDTARADTSDGGRPTRGLLEHVGFDDQSMGIFTEEGQTGVPDIDESLSFVTSPVRAGSHAVRVHIDADWDFSDVNSTRVNPLVRSNAKQRLRDNDYSVYGEPFWTGFSFYVPPNWEPDTVTEQIAEFHRDISDNPGDTNRERFEWAGAQSGAGKPLTLRVEGDQLQVVNDKLPRGVETWDWENRDQQNIRTLQPGTWYDIVMHIKWSNQTDDEKGFVKIWIDGELAYSDEGENVARDRASPRPMKFGVYKWDWSNGNIDRRTRIYLFDDFRLGNADARYATVAPSGHPP